MNIKSQFGLAGLLCVISLGVFAQSMGDSEIVQTSRSVGKQVSDNSINLLEAVKSKDIVNGKPLEEETLESTDQQTVIANRYDQYFSIYDADVELLSDLDGDGFHHALNVIFDVDVDHDVATLYAKLYLSREGGRWIQYTTTDLFQIFENDAGDAYEVTTELLEGYPPGYYAVLVEVYSLNHVGMVASEIVDHNYLGKDIRLEDYRHDEVTYYEEDVYYEEEVMVTTHGAGSFSIFFWLLLVQVVIAARGVLTLSPLKTIIIKKGTSGLRSFIPARLTNPHSAR